MQAGKALDALVAQHVTRLEPMFTSTLGKRIALYRSGPLGLFGKPPSYSTNVAEAFAVADHLWQARGLALTLSNAGGSWYAEFASPGQISSGSARAATPAEAIARAALAAVGVDVE